MAKVETFKCDVCGKQKTDLNHWFTVEETGTGITLRHWERSSPEDAVKHLCGQACVISALSDWMGSN